MKSTLSLALSRVQYLVFTSDFIAGEGTVQCSAKGMGNDKAVLALLSGVKIRVDEEKGEHRSPYLIKMCLP